jgi:hypothetical protein
MNSNKIHFTIPECSLEEKEQRSTVDIEDAYEEVERRRLS